MSGQCAWFMTDLATEPDQGAIHLSRTPAESITEAAECRSVCKPDRAWKPGANRGSLERTQRIAWVAALAQLGREHIRRPVPGRACLRRYAACQVRTSRNTRSVGERGIRRSGRWQPVLRKAT